jgi:hypothetical protein
MMQRARLILWTLIVLSLAADVAYFLGGERARLFVANARDGCFPWSPAVVEFSPGMTICPGQMVVITIQIPVPAQALRLPLPPPLEPRAKPMKGI